MKAITFLDLVKMQRDFHLPYMFAVINMVFSAKIAQYMNLVYPGNVEQNQALAIT
jgi:hypothetical protein